MKTVIMLCSLAPPECSWSVLKDHHAQWVLVLPPETFNKMTDSQKVYFDDIIVVNELTVDSVVRAIHSVTTSINLIDVMLLPTQENTLLVAAKVREKLALPGDTVEYVNRFIDKSLMKEMLLGSDVHLPRYMTCSLGGVNKESEVIEKIELTMPTYPLFYKPCDSYGGIGVGVIDDSTALKDWLRSSTGDRYLIEEFLQGVMYHIDSVVCDHQILLQCAAEYAWPCDQFFTGRPIGSIVLPFDSVMYQRLKIMNESVIASLSPNHCVTHMECFHTKDDRLVFVEIAARAPGGRIVDLYQRQWQVNFSLMHLQLQLGIQPAIELQDSGQYYAWAFIPLSPGTISTLDIPDFLSRTHIEWFVKPGQFFDVDYFDQSEMLFSQKYLAGLIIINNENYRDLMTDFNLIRQHRFVEYTSDT